VVSNGYLTKNSNEATLTVQTVTHVGTINVPPGGSEVYLNGGLPIDEGRYRVKRIKVGDMACGFVNTNFYDGRIAGAKYTCRHNNRTASTLTSGTADIWYFTGTRNENTNPIWVAARDAANAVLENTYVEFDHTGGTISIDDPYVPDPNFPMASGATLFAFYLIG
jgi:hypothetical protein